MDHAYHTRELAKAYETQGYYRQALDIYTVLNRHTQGKDTDILTACKRVEPLAAEAEYETRKPSGRSSGGLVDIMADEYHLTTLDNLISWKRSRQ